MNIHAKFSNVLFCLLDSVSLSFRRKYSIHCFSFSSEYLKSINYEAESPDEAALVYAAHAYGLSLAKRDKDTVTVALPKENTSITFQVCEFCVLTAFILDY